MLALFLSADSYRTLRTTPIQSPDGDRHLGAMTIEQRLASWHVVLADGAVASGGRALTVVLRALPAGRPLARLTGALPAVADRASCERCGGRW